MPKKEFIAFTRLDASDVNTFLMDQSVMTFATSAARGSAIATPSEGMVSYLDDTNSVELYNGSAWVNASNTGRGLVAFSDSLVNTTFASSTNTTILEVTFDVFAGRRYSIVGKIAVQPSATTAPNALFVSETTMGTKLLDYRTAAIGANLNEAFQGFHSATAANMGVTSGSSSKTVSLQFRCGSAGGIATNPDGVLGADSFVPQLYVEDIGAA
jgi:hypothetical protein